MKTSLWIRVGAACVTIGMATLLYRYSRQVQVTDWAIRLLSPNTSTLLRSNELASRAPADVLINGYMRSGSSFIGRLLGHRNDTFYWYEPLQKHELRWQYLHGTNQLCDSTKPSCRVTNNTKVLDNSLRMLSDIFNCSFQAHWNTIADAMHPQVGMGGPSWKTYLECRKSPSNYTQAYCLKEMIPICQNHNHRVTKVLRMTIDNLATLLDTNPRLKVIHIFRDPRGVINSHFRTNWFPVSSTSNMNVLQNDAKALCGRMLYDIEVGKKLTEQYPGRVKFLLYERFDDETRVKKIFELYDFLGMSYSQTNAAFIQETAGNSKKNQKSVDSPSNGNHPFMYRTALNWTVVSTIDAECRPVYEALGYVRFCNVKELKNMNISGLVNHFYLN